MFRIKRTFSDTLSARPASRWSCVAARLRCWRRDESGVAAVELAIAMPFLVLVLSGLIQFGSIFFLQNNMHDVARDIARRVAVGELDGVAAQAFAQSKLVNWGVNFTVNIHVPDPNDKDATVEITTPLAEASIIDILGIFQSGTLRAVSTMRQE